MKNKYEIVWIFVCFTRPMTGKEAIILVISKVKVITLNFLMKYQPNKYRFNLVGL